MSTKTSNHNLTKPALTDPADITATNGNWDIIDELLKRLTVNGMVLIEGVDYGTEFPTNPVVGQLFFKKVGE